MRRLVLVIFSVWVWIALLAAVFTTIARLGTGAKDRRAPGGAAQHSKAR